MKCSCLDCASSVTDITGSPVVQEIFRKYSYEDCAVPLQFLCWANRIHYYAAEGMFFFRAVGHRQAKKAGCKFVIMENLS